MIHQQDMSDTVNSRPQFQTYILGLEFREDVVEIVHELNEMLRALQLVSKCFRLACSTHLI
jgi:hypothetical protein